MVRDIGQVFDDSIWQNILHIATQITYQFAKRLRCIHDRREAVRNTSDVFTDFNGIANQGFFDLWVGERC